MAAIAFSALCKGIALIRAVIITLSASNRPVLETLLWYTDSAIASLL